MFAPSEAKSQYRKVVMTTPQARYKSPKVWCPVQEPMGLTGCGTPAETGLEGEKRALI